MITQKKFFEKYKNITRADFEQTQIKWQDLELIYNDYVNFKDELLQSAVYLFNTLMTVPEVHSVRYRIKNEEHLIEKIIRKKIEKPDEPAITLGDYKKRITDLIGIRALHLFKGDWEPINDFIKTKWDLTELPKAYYREGDSSMIINVYEQKGCKCEPHKKNYRSVHFLVKTKPAKTEYIAEIQVRTIFEEAWAEIDHTICYPYDLNNQIYTEFLSILNRLAGSADEMGSYILLLKNYTETQQRQHQEQLKEKIDSISALEKKIGKLSIKADELESIKADIASLKIQELSSSTTTTIPNFAGITSGLKSLGEIGINSLGKTDIPSVLKLFGELGKTDIPSVLKLFGELGKTDSHTIPLNFFQESSNILSTTTATTTHANIPPDFFATKSKNQSQVENSFNNPQDTEKTLKQENLDSESLNPE